jgi:hypothetical protein
LRLTRPAPATAPTACSRARREIPVLVLDFLFVGWIYVGLNRIKADLTTTGQQVRARARAKEGERRAG